MNNAKQPIYPQNENWQNDMEKHLSNVGRYSKPSMVGVGLTKREQACIQLGIPKTGDAELDEIIMLAERKKMAAMAMQGYLSNSAESEITTAHVLKTIGLPTETKYSFEEHYPKYVAKISLMYADELLKQLESNDKV